MLWSCFAASGPAALKKVNGIMEKEDYLQMFQKKTKIIIPCFWVQLGVPTGQWSQTHIKNGKGMDQSG